MCIQTPTLHSRFDPSQTINLSPRTSKLNRYRVETSHSMSLPVLVGGTVRVTSYCCMDDTVAGVPVIAPVDMSIDSPSGRAGDMENVPLEEA